MGAIPFSANYILFFIYFTAFENQLMPISKYFHLFRYPDNRPPRKIALRLGLGFGSRSRLVLGLGGNQTISRDVNCRPPPAPPPKLGLGLGLGLVLRLGAVFLGSNCYRTIFSHTTFR